NSKQYKKELNKELEDEQKDYTKKISANEAKLNSQITAETKIASGKQLDILQNLKNHKGKLSLEDAKSAILNSKKQRDKLIGDAKKTANGAIDAADKKYNETVKKADKERFENGTMSKKQYDEVIKNAKQQRDDAVKAAEKTKNKSIKHATDTHEQVVKQAEKQAGEHKGSLDKETGYVKGSTEDQTSKYYDSIDASIDMINWIWGLFSNNKKKFSHISRKSLTGHKDGLFDVTHGEIAIVGEEGMELAHHPNKGIYPVGVNGEEVRYLEPNTSILPHEQSKQFLSMAQGLPHYKKGKGNFIDDLLDGAKGMVGKITSEAKNVWKIISGSAEKAWEFLAKKFSINDKFKQIQSKGELSKAGGGLVAHESKSAVTEMLSKMIGKVKSLFDSDANAPTSGPPGAGVERWKDLVKKALDANGLSTSGAMID
ncbi:UNVERIFIED_CONTAM: hypothetical protein QQF86_09245, partial [Melissococcus plutonius]